MTRRTRISDRAAGRDNNFNLIRMLAATGVLVSHAFPIALGPGVTEPLEAALKGVTLGEACVMVFFGISGFFIARSFAQRRAFRPFVEARARRLFPALAVVLALTVLLGAAFTAAPAAFWHAAPDYYLRNLTLFFPRYELPGVFEANPYGPPINGSLWTLGYEVLCYAGVVLAGALGLLARPRAFAAAVAAFLVTYALTLVLSPHPRLELLMFLGLPFLTGMAFWVWRERIVLSLPLALGLLAVTALSWPTPFFHACLSVSLPYLVFVLGYARSPALGLYNRLGDYSYGMYVYAFPAQQILAANGVVTPLQNIALALPATLACAVLSWHLIEAPALRPRQPRLGGQETPAE